MMETNPVNYLTLDFTTPFKTTFNSVLLLSKTSCITRVFFYFCFLKSKRFSICEIQVLINTLKPELNPICYLLALLGAHHFLHVSRIRVKLLTFRLLMSYIHTYIYIYIYIYIWSTHSGCF